MVSSECDETRALEEQETIWLQLLQANPARLVQPVDGLIEPERFSLQWMTLIVDLFRADVPPTCDERPVPLWISWMRLMKVNLHRF